MRRLYPSLFMALLSVLYAENAGAFESEKTAKVACYHYDPSDPYVDPKQKSLFNYVKDTKPISGLLRGSFFVSHDALFGDLESRCNAQIPQGHSLLKLRALYRGKEYPISVGEQSRRDAFKRIVVLGDSLSEEGKVVVSLQKVRRPVGGAAMMGLARMLGCRIPEHFLEFGLKPYWNGMFSNGPMWPHYLSQFLDNIAVLNLSFGGVTTGSRKCHMIHLQSLLRRHLRANPHRELISENLYLIWLGANNYFYPGGLPEQKLREQRRGEAVAQSMLDLEKSVETLLSRGAGHVVLFSVPSPKKSPSWSSFYDPDDTIGEIDTHRLEWRKSVALHNKELRAKVKAMAQEWGSRVSFFDAEALFESEEDALDMDPDIMWKDEHESRHFSELIKVPGYFDAVHPTTKIHCLTAQHAITHLQSIGLAADYPTWSCDEHIERLLYSTSSKS